MQGAVSAESCRFASLLQHTQTILLYIEITYLVYDTPELSLYLSIHNLLRACPKATNLSGKLSMLQLLPIRFGKLSEG